MTALAALEALGGKFSEANSNCKRNVARERRQGTSPVNERSLETSVRCPRGKVATESCTRGRVEGAAGVAYALGTRTGGPALSQCTVRAPCMYLASKQANIHT
eukprot:7011177-Prymnesium_polylepis.1